MPDRLTEEMLLTENANLRAQLKNEKGEVAIGWEARHALIAATDQLKAAQEQIRKLSGEAAGEQVRATIERMGAEKDQLDADRATASAECDELKKQLEAAASEIAELRKKLESGAEYDELKRQLEEVTAERDELRAKFGQAAADNAMIADSAEAAKE